MKSRNYIVTYLSALVIGILLLIFYQRQSLYQTMVIVIGALIAVPSLVLMLSLLLRKRPQGASTKSGAGAVTAASTIGALAGLALGIWMMCSPHFFISAIIYTLGAILLLVGLAQISFIFQASRPFRPAGGWFIVPVVTLAAGVVLIVAGPARIAAYAGLITGIVLVVYAANGFASAGREAKLARDIDDMEKEKLREEAADRSRRDTSTAQSEKKEHEGGTAAMQ